MDFAFKLRKRLCHVGFPGGSDGKEFAPNAKTWVWPLGWEDPLEKGVATHSSILAWVIPWIEEPGELQSMGLQRAGRKWVTNTHTHTHTHTMSCILRNINFQHHRYGFLPNVVLNRHKIKLVKEWMTQVTLSPSGRTCILPTLSITDCYRLAMWSDVYN